MSASVAAGGDICCGEGSDITGHDNGVIGGDRITTLEGCCIMGPLVAIMFSVCSDLQQQGIISDHQRLFPSPNTVRTNWHCNTLPEVASQMRPPLHQLQQQINSQNLHEMKLQRDIQIQKADLCKNKRITQYYKTNCTCNATT
jgi:hypothetical protein